MNDNNDQSNIKFEARCLEQIWYCVGGIFFAWVSMVHGPWFHPLGHLLPCVGADDERVKKSLPQLRSGETLGFDDNWSWFPLVTSWKGNWGKRPWLFPKDRSVVKRINHNIYFLMEYNTHNSIRDTDQDANKVYTVHVHPHIKSFCRFAPHYKGLAWWVVYPYDALNYQCLSIPGFLQVQPPKCHEV